MAKIFASSVVNAPADEVWGAIRDFNGLPSWHPALAASNRAYVQWTAEFEPDPGQDGQERADFIGTNVFQVGFDALKERFGG